MKTITVNISDEWLARYEQSFGKAVRVQLKCDAWNAVYKAIERGESEASIE